MSKRFTIQFYGGWFVIDNANRKSGDVVYNETATVETKEQAEELAALHNRTGDRLPITSIHTP